MNRAEVHRTKRVPIKNSPTLNRPESLICMFFSNGFAQIEKYPTEFISPLSQDGISSNYLTTNWKLSAKQVSL
jgi:hypothetical protein